MRRVTMRPGLALLDRPYLLCHHRTQWEAWLKLGLNKNRGKPRVPFVLVGLTTAIICEGSSSLFSFVMVILPIWCMISFFQCLTDFFPHHFEMAMDCPEKSQYYPVMDMWCDIFLLDSLNCPGFNKLSHKYSMCVKYSISLFRVQ